LSQLLDTCVLSEFQKPRPEPRVVEWLRGQEEELLFLRVLTLGELQRGVSKLAPSKKHDRLQVWLDADLPTRFAGRILPIDERVAVEWGRLQALAEARGRPIPVVDGLLAATALVHHLSVVTRNRVDFAGTDVHVVDPWVASP
jgi:predicted nucleic acid-binding protein